MADDIQNENGDWLAADDLGGNRKIKRVKLAIGGNGVAVDVDDSNPIPVRGTTPRVTAQVNKPASATQYALGDHIAGSLTGSAVNPIVFTMPRPAGRISGARAVVTAASGAIVFPAFDLILFRPETNIPFASNSYPADNEPLTISAAAYREAVAVIPFSASLWRNQAGAFAAAGPTGYQPGVPTLRPFAPFNLTGLANQQLRGVIQAQSTWNPGNVAYTIDFALDVDAD